MARRRGQAMVEFAMVVIVFLTLVLGMLQFGIYLSVTNALWNLSREGARVACVQTAGTTNADQTITNAVKGRVPSNIDPTKLTVEVLPKDTSLRTSGSKVTVNLSYDMSNTLFIPLPSALFDRGLGKTYKTSTSMMVE